MKVKFANKIFEVLYTKEVAGLTMYAVEDEPNHIKWLVNVEVVDAEKKELKKIKQNPTWSEEDESNFDEAIYYIRREPYRECDVEPIVDWLKFLKERMKGE